MIIDQLIQSQLFHLISMLLCVGVIVWLLSRHYFRGEYKVEEDKIRSLNILYISGILTFIIIELVTAICMNNTKASDILSFVSFAATLSSLILSVVAIIFTIVSGNRGEYQYQKLDKASDKVKESLTQFSKKTETFDATIDRFQEVANGLSKEIHSIYEKLSGLEKPIFEMREQMGTNESIVKEIKTKDGVFDESFKSHVSAFVANGSFSGNLALLACVLSQETGHPFIVSQISEGEDDQSYKFGYIIASRSMGVISTKIKDKRNIEVISYYDGLKEMLDKALTAYINTIKDEKIRQLNNERIDKIKAVFV